MKRAESSELLIKRKVRGILRVQGEAATLRIYPMYADFIKASKGDIEKAIKEVTVMLYAKA